MTFIPNTLYEKTRYMEIFFRMTSMEKSHSPLEALVKMQTEQGIDAETAERNAMACISAVAGREATMEILSEDSAAVMDRFFEILRGKEPDVRMETLQRTLFGLTLQETPATAEEAEQLFQSWAAGRSDSFETLELEVLQAVGQYRVSPTSLRMLTRKLKKTDGCMATAMALGESGRNLKCLMTMELWLQNQETMSMAEAANVACTSADYQAVSDAVRKGFITREVAKKILIAIGIATVVLGILYFTMGVFANPIVAMGTQVLEEDLVMSFLGQEALSMAEFQSIAESMLFLKENAGLIKLYGFFTALLGGTVAALSKYGANLVGTVGAWVSGLFQSAEDAAPAMEDLADIMEEEEDVLQQDQPAAPVHDTPILNADAFAPAEAEADEDPDLIGF